MFDYPLSILVCQKTNSYLLRQNLFPALRARRRAEFVRQEGIVLLLDSNKILGVCRNHASAKIQFEVMVLPQLINRACRPHCPFARARLLLASGLRSAHLLGTTQFVAQLRRRDGRQGSDGDRAP